MTSGDGNALTWEDLTEAERRDVDALSKVGQRHPDPEVAQAADEWARDTLSAAGGVGTLLTSALDVGLSALLGGSGGGTTGWLLAQRRLAKRIVAATDGQSSS